MGPPELKPEFPDLEWTRFRRAQRFATRHIQECNWLQGVEGGFDATHLTFLHGGDTEHSRRIVATMYEVIPTDFGFIVGTGRDPGNGTIIWNVERDPDAVPQDHLVGPHAAHVWAPIDDENTMLYSIDFNPDRAAHRGRAEALQKSWRGIHTENHPGTDHAIRNRANDYLIDRALQASGKSYTGMKGLGTRTAPSRNRWGRSPTARRSICSRATPRS